MKEEGRRKEKGTLWHGRTDQIQDEDAIFGERRRFPAAASSGGGATVYCCSQDGGGEGDRARGRRQQVELLLEEGGARGGASAREFEAAGSTCSGTRAPWEELGVGGALEQGAGGLLVLRWLAVAGGGADGVAVGVLGPSASGRCARTGRVEVSRRRPRA